MFPILFTCFLFLDLSFAMEWQYENQERWGRDFPECDGNRQSPIDIDTDNVERDESLSIEYDGYEERLRNGKIVNNGHTAQVDFPNARRLPTISGSAFKGEKYRFEQLHFHWGSKDSRGSEHLINDKSFGAELHLVHWNVKYGNFSTASRRADGLAVIGVLIEIRRDQPNQGYKEIVKGVRQLTSRNQDEKVDVLPFRLFDLMPKRNRSFFAYQGSLTTPPCSETVNWVVMAEPTFLGGRQIKYFRELRDKNGNRVQDTFRKVQPIGQRTIYFSNELKFSNFY